MRACGRNGWFREVLLLVPAESNPARTGAWGWVQPNDMSDVSEARLCAAGSQSEASLLLGREGTRLRSSRSSRLELGQPMEEQMKAGTSRSSDELPAILRLTPSTGRHPSPSSTRSQRGPRAAGGGWRNGPQVTLDEERGTFRLWPDSQTSDVGTPVDH